MVVSSRGQKKVNHHALLYVLIFYRLNKYAKPSMFFCCFFLLCLLSFRFRSEGNELLVRIIVCTMKKLTKIVFFCYVFIKFVWVCGCLPGVAMGGLFFAVLSTTMFPFVSLFTVILTCVREFLQLLRCSGS